MTVVVLVRHAATAWTGRRFCGRSDPPLDAEGLASLPGIAEGVAEALGEQPRVTIVTSPLARARATADAIARRLDVAPARHESDWREADFGDAEGLTWDEVEARFPAIAERLLAGDRAIDWPGGERHVDLERRITRAWSRTLAEAATVPMVVVAHAGSIRVAAGLAGSQVDGLAPGELVRLEPDGGVDARS